MPSRSKFVYRVIYLFINFHKHFHAPTKVMQMQTKSEQTFFLAAWNNDLTRRAPTPTNLPIKITMRLSISSVEVILGNSLVFKVLIMLCFILLLKSYAFSFQFLVLVVYAMFL